MDILVLKPFPVSFAFLRKVLDCLLNVCACTFTKSLHQFILCIKVIPIYFIFSPPSHKTVPLMWLVSIYMLPILSDLELPWEWGVFKG